MADFPVDVWLVFGSFVYGFEGIITEFATSSAVIRIQTRTPEESEDLASFFDEIAASPRDLVKSEVRVYCDSLEHETEDISFPVSLFTDVSPMVPGGEKPAVRFSLLRGTTEGDALAWNHLVNNVWPSFSR